MFFLRFKNYTNIHRRPRVGGKRVLTPLKLTNTSFYPPLKIIQKYIRLPPYTFETTIDILLLGLYTRFSCSLIKWNLLRAKKNDFLFQPVTPYPPTGWVYWPKNEFNISKLNWRQFFLCHNIPVYSTSIKTTHLTPSK